MAVGTTTTTSTLLKNYWHDFFLSVLVDFRAFSPGLTKKAAVPTGNGKVVWWYGLTKTSPVGASLTEGADPTARSSASRRVSGTLTEYGNLVKNSRLFMDTAIDGAREEIIKDLARDAAKVIDDTLITAAVGGGTVLFGASTSHRSNIIEATTATIKDVRKAVRLLQLSSVPPFADGFYVGLVHPDVAFDLQTDSAWTDIVKYRDTVKYDLKGEVGRIWGIRFVVAPTIPVLLNSGSASTDIYRTLIFGPDFLGESHMGSLEVVINEPGRGSELRQFNTYGYRFVMATGVLQNARCIRLETNASLA